MTDERGQKPNEGESRGLSPLAIGVTLGGATVAWMILKLLSQLMGAP